MKVTVLKTRLIRQNGEELLLKAGVVNQVVPEKFKNNEFLKHFISVGDIVPEGMNVQGSGDNTKAIEDAVKEAAKTVAAAEAQAKSIIEKAEEKAAEILQAAEEVAASTNMVKATEEKKHKKGK